MTCGPTEQQAHDGDGGGGADSTPAGSAGESAGRLQVDLTCTPGEPTLSFVECQQGWRHRPQAVACEILGSGGAPSPGAGGEAPVDQRNLPRVDGHAECGENGENCRQFQWGYCNSDEGAACYSGCEVDADCGPAQSCVCSGPSPTGGHCHTALCLTDADCPGSLCASAIFDRVTYGEIGLACLTARDKCLTNDDCDDGGCAWDDATQARVCSNQR